MEPEEYARQYVVQRLELPTSSFANTREFHPRPDKFEPVRLRHNCQLLKVPPPPRFQTPLARIHF